MLLIALLTLSGIGSIAIIVGRLIMIRDACYDRSFIAKVAIFLLPMTEFPPLIRSFSKAKKGAITSIVGMWLTVPLLCYALIAVEEHAKKMQSQLERQMKNTSADSAATEEKLIASMPAEFASGWYARKEELRKERETSVGQLRVRMEKWHAQMQASRATLDVKDEAAVKAFNEQAAAYSRLNAFAKKETDLMLAMLPKKAGP
jgi:hypothetical protein